MSRHHLQAMKSKSTLSKFCESILTKQSGMQRLMKELRKDYADDVSAQRPAAIVPMGSIFKIN